MAAVEKIFPLTSMQQAMLFHNLKDEQRSAYLNQHIIEMKGKIDIDVFTKAISALTERFEIFRTRIVYKKLERPVQVVLKKADMDFKIFDFSGYSSDVQKSEIEKFLEQDKEKGFELDKDIPCRITLIKLNDELYQNIWSFHHILMDGFCVNIIAEDFFKIYNFIKNDKEIKLPDTVSYQVYQNWLDKQSKDKALKYWEEYLDNYNNNTLLLGDRDISGEESRTYFADIPQDIFNSALKYSAEKNITMNILTQCIWGIIIQAYNNSNDIVFGSVAAARPLTLKDYERIVGLFVNTLPVRVKTNENSTIKSLIASLNNDFLNQVSYSYCSLGEIQSVRKFNGELVSHLYVFQNFSLESLYDGAKKSGIEIIDMQIRHNSGYNLSVEVIQRDSLKLKICFNHNKYSEKYIKELSDNFLKLLDAAANKKIESIEKLRSLVNVSVKISKKNLPEVKKDETEKIYTAPSTDLEIKLAEIFKKVLKVEKIGISDDFFYLGGNSIKGMQVIAMCEQQGIPLKLSELFVGCNIETISKIISKKEKSQNKNIVSEKAPMKDDWFKPFPLNDIQRAYIIGQDASFELGMFSPQYYTEFEGDIDIERLSESFNKVIEHQMALRSRIININEQVIIEKMDKFVIPIIDVSDYDEEKLNKFLSDIRDSMSIHTVNIEDYPYFQVKAIKLRENYYRVCFNMDSLCVDGFGLGMMLNEVREAYNNPDTKFKPIDFSVRDYNMYLEELKNTPKYEEDKKYWLDRVDTLPINLELPTLGSSKNIKNPRFLRKEYLLTDNEYLKLKNFAAENKVTVPSVICAAYMEVLALWSGQNKFTVNMTVFDRHDFNHDVKNIIGDFTKLIYIESDTSDKSFISKAKKVNSNIISDLEHNTFSSMEMSRKLAAKRYHGKKAILPYVFTCAISDDTKEADMEFFKNVYAISRTPQVYIDNQVTQRGKSILVNWDYPEGLFDDNMISDMFKQYIDIILNVSDDVSAVISDREKSLIEKYNETNLSEDEKEKIRNTSLIDLIKESFERYPDNIAVKDNANSITYKELDILSDEAAVKLEEEGIKAGDTVAVIGNRTVETVVNMIAAIKVGAAYVPVNTEYPKDRIDYMLEKSQCCKVIDDDFVNKNLSECRKHEYVKVDAESTAYIIFTSGSTGNPKGVVIKHYSAVNTILDINKKFNVCSSDRLMCLASFGFDLSVYDVYGSLSAGAELYICSQQKNPEELVASIEKENITVWNSVPAVMQMLISCLKPEWKNNSLRLVLMSGDWIPVKLPAQIKEHFPNAKPISLGGATEGSIWSIYYPINDIPSNLNSVPYGMPLTNQKMYVLNDKLEYCPIGVKGEICIGGLGVASGYINDIEKTENAFINHPELGYIYRTGDYGKMHKEGFIEFLGRIDNQVKIHGYRVELGEIEAKASEIQGVRQAVVLLQKQGAGASLKMFMECDNELDSENVKKILRETLPEYMIPRNIVYMQQLPVTQNGKIDRKKLLENSIDESAEYRIEPKNEKEKLLADIWKKVLETNKIEMDRSFFEFGVDSLKAIHFISEIKNEGYEVSMMDIYSNDTVEKLAETLKDSSSVFEEDGDMFEDGVL